jgi:hypothetical protein
LKKKASPSKILAHEIDEDINIIKVKNNLVNIDPSFRRLRNLGILRISETNITAIGHNSFWGLASLRILGIIKKINENDMKLFF